MMASIKRVAAEEYASRPGAFARDFLVTNTPVVLTGVVVAQHWSMAPRQRAAGAAAADDGGRESRVPNFN